MFTGKFKSFAVTLIFIGGITVLSSEQLELRFKTDPLTRYTKIIYKVPASAPDTITVKCKYQLAGEETWYSSAVRKYRSVTAENIVALDKKNDLMANELSSGEVTEYLAAGKTRTLIWQTSPQIPVDFKGQVKVKLAILDGQKKQLATGSVSIKLKNSDVIVLNDFSKLFPGLGNGTNPGWHFVKSFDKRILGTLEAIEGEALLEPVMFRPQLSGYYAIFVSVPKDPVSCIRLRLSSDFYSQRFMANL